MLRTVNLAMKHLHTLFLAVRITGSHCNVRKALQVGRKALQVGRKALQVIRKALQVVRKAL